MTKTPKTLRRLNQILSMSLIVAVVLAGCGTESRKLSAEYLRTEPLEGWSNSEIAVLGTTDGSEIKLIISSSLDKLAVKGTKYCVTYGKTFGGSPGYHIKSMTPQTEGECEW